MFDEVAERIEMTKPKCCFIPDKFQGNPEKSPWCKNPCNWEIRDADSGNPLENDTYSCDKHLSKMLTDNNTVHYIGGVDNARQS
jgi:hypothetical protein